MKGQMSIEFLAILAILLGYLTFFFGTFKTLEKSLEEACLKKFSRELGDYLELCNSFPEGSMLKARIKAPPKGKISIECFGDKTRIIYEVNGKSYEEVLDLSSTCTSREFEGSVKATFVSLANTCEIRWE